MLFITCALPVPDGYAMIARIVPATHRFDEINDLKLLTDFVYVAYEGTLRQWKDFLGQPSILPGLLGSVKIDFTPGASFTYASDRVSFLVPQEVQPVTPENLLALAFGYYEDHGKVVWDVGDIRLKRTSPDNDWVNVQRHIKPSEDHPEAAKNIWDKVSHQVHPFDGVSRTENDMTKITTVVPEQPGEESGAIYTAYVQITGVIPQETMKAKMDLFLKDLHVKEH